MEGLGKVNVTVELPGLEAPYQYLSAGEFSVTVLPPHLGEGIKSRAEQAAIDFQEARAPFLIFLTFAARGSTAQVIGGKALFAAGCWDPTQAHSSNSPAASQRQRQLGVKPWIWSGGRGEHKGGGMKPRERGIGNPLSV